MGEKNCPRGGKIDIKTVRGGKIGGKNCLRGVKLDKPVWGSQEKNMFKGGKKNHVLCQRGVRKIPRGVKKSQFCPRG